ncbi:carbonic anhydrase [Georgenia thermotolerans]|uniref:carbonic anhydrase n=1 Tax=Georgenia thermotolerans TaxID=527326 RepID=A0A7J5UQZ8_9MICO|nr:carbonic anhydrase [Georgenia thermotolerans]KAE8764769.1 carbonic anhydrase [Georgenia thermotolerans]
MSTDLTPAQAWQRLQEGNARFVADNMQHPSQGADRRAEVAQDQNPYAVLFGCSDSRVAAELIFDQGLGDLFVVRTAGQVLDTTVIGSIEYGVDVLGAPLVVVLGHDRCGAVGAATRALLTGEMPTGFVRAVVDRVIPSLLAPTEDGGAPAAGPTRGVRLADDADLRRQHVTATVTQLHDYSVSLATAVAEGRTAIVGVEYTLADGTANLVHQIGNL